MSDTLVRVENVSKKFCRSLRRSLWYGLQDLGNELRGRTHHAHDHLREDEFWAVRDVSFELKRGECLGLIGHNGAGKTTLLRMLNGLIMPDSGKVEMRGRVGALIALGAGFHPLLSGRENIYVNGAVLGMKRNEVTRKFAEIVEFSGLEDFMDAPVQSYSSGMAVRLGFSIAVKLIKPDILLLDEVLAVGDQSFRARCYEAISEQLTRSAVVFVSHSMPAIRRISGRTLLLSTGAVMHYGDTAVGIDLYMRSLTDSGGARRSLGTGEAKVLAAAFCDRSGQPIAECAHGDEVRLRMALRVTPDISHFDVSVGFIGSADELVAQCHSRMHNLLFQNTGVQTFDVNFGRLLLNPGHYRINVIASDNRGMRHLCWEANLLRLIVSGPFASTAPIQLLADWTVSPGLSLLSPDSAAPDCHGD